RRSPRQISREPDLLAQIHPLEKVKRRARRSAGIACMFRQRRRRSSVIFATAPIRKSRLLFTTGGKHRAVMGLP
ncbi:MAG: hypothetical protein ABI541_06110, partial [Betaproteobacteria bacterium]